MCSIKQTHVLTCFCHTCNFWDPQNSLSSLTKGTARLPTKPSSLPIRFLPIPLFRLFLNDFSLQWPFLIPFWFQLYKYTCFCFSKGLPATKILDIKMFQVCMPYCCSMAFVRTCSAVAVLLIHYSTTQDSTRTWVQNLLGALNPGLPRLKINRLCITTAFCPPAPVFCSLWTRSYSQMFHTLTSQRNRGQTMDKPWNLRLFPWNGGLLPWNGCFLPWIGVP